MITIIPIAIRFAIASWLVPECKKTQAFIRLSNDLKRAEKMAEWKSKAADHYREHLKVIHERSNPYAYDFDIRGCPDI